MTHSTAAVTTTLKRLEKEGYIARSTTDEDNRKNEIRITEAGRAAVDQSRALFYAVDKNMFKGMSEEELEAFTKVLERMRENLTEADPE